LFYSKDYYAFLEEGEGSSAGKAKPAGQPKPAVKQAPAQLEN